MNKTDLAKDRTDFAEQRTDWAEDRTMMASERTFAGWLRTAIAAMALGLGFNALFKTIELTYVPKTVATLFIAVGLFIVLAAYANARRVARRIEAHAVNPIPVRHLRFITGSILFGGAALAGVLWLS